MQVIQCWSNTEANKTHLHCFLLTNLLELVTDLTHNTEENSEHPQSHPYNTPAVTQFWHPRKMHIRAKKNPREKKPKRELRTRGDDVHVQLAHHTLKSLPRPIPCQQTLASKGVGREKTDSYKSLILGQAQSAVALIPPPTLP